MVALTVAFVASAVAFAVTFAACAAFWAVFAETFAAACAVFTEVSVVLIAALEVACAVLIPFSVVGHYAYVANVGDSRLYVIGEKIQQITRDHSLVQEMVRMGELDPEQARKHPKKNIITRALGAEKTVDIDFFDLKLEPGDVVLMCSDGLSNMVEDSQLREIISDTSTDLDEKGRILIREANRNGGKDNIAIVLVEPFTDEVKAC